MKRPANIRLFAKGFQTLVFLFSLSALVCWICGISGCSSEDTRKPDPTSVRKDDQYSLTADRKQLDELRSQVPPEKKLENDEIAYTLQLFNDTTKEPYSIRDKFDSAVHKRRDLFDKNMTREREGFSKNETKQREAFMTAQSKSREAFQKEKHSREDVADFFKDQDEKRRDFFAKERDQRGDFESTARDKRKDFDDYIREKNNDFNQEYRAYTRRYEDLKRQKEQEKKAAEANKGNEHQNAAAPPNPAASDEAKSLQQEIDSAKGMSGTPLESGE